MDKLEWGLIGLVTGYVISDTVNYFIKQYRFRKALKMMKYLNDMEQELRKRKEREDKHD
jgi:type III secretory pathway component EscU